MYQTHTDLGIHKKFKKRFKKLRRKLKKVIKKVVIKPIKTVVTVPVKLVSKVGKKVFKLPILLTTVAGGLVSAKALTGKKKKKKKESKKPNKVGITPKQMDAITKVVAGNISSGNKSTPTVVAPQPISRGSQRFTPAVVYSPGRPPAYINDEGEPTDKSGGMSTAVKVGAVVGAVAVGYLVIKG